MVKVIKKISDGVDKVTMVIACVFMVIVVLASSLQVFTRYVMNASLSWTEECSRYCFVWATMMGAAVAYKRGSHVALDIISGRLKGKAKFVQRIITQLFVILLCVVMICNSPSVLRLTSTQLSTAMRIPMICFYISIPLGFLAIMIHAINGLAETISDRKSAE